MYLYSVLQINLEPCSFIRVCVSVCVYRPRGSCSARFEVAFRWWSPTDYELSGSNLSALVNSVMDGETNQTHRGW